jgi:hypothetical protein
MVFHSSSVEENNEASWKFCKTWSWTYTGDQNVNLQIIAT